jgi:hypothetical protein
VYNERGPSLRSEIDPALHPEPGLLLLIASGVAGLGLVGRSRMKK